MRIPVLVLVTCCALTGCSNGGKDGGRAAATTSPVAPSTAVPDIVLPAGPLRELVPETGDLPPGMVPIVSGTGPRDVQAVAGYSADPSAAQRLLVTHGFQSAYVAQYADPASGRVLSVVVSRFATAAGATADLTGDLTGSTGSPVPTPTVGDQSQVLVQPLPQAKTPGQLVTVRFRKAATTWLVAYGAAPSADPEVALELARLLVDRLAAPVS